MFWSFCFVLFVILKSLFAENRLRIVRADQHCPQPAFISTCQRVSIRNQKAKQRRLWTVSLGVEVTSSCLCVGQAFSQGKELFCHTNSVGPHLKAEAWLGVGEIARALGPGVSTDAHHLWGSSKSLSTPETPSLFYLPGGFLRAGQWGEQTRKATCQKLEWCCYCWSWGHPWDILSGSPHSFIFFM